MNTTKQILFFWSGGKDSALALSRLIKDPTYKVVAIVTTLDRQSNSVRYHGIPEALIVEHAKLLNLPLVRIYLDRDMTNEEYLDHISKKLSVFIKKGVSEIGFGDIHLEDMKTFKEKLCSIIGVKACFPLWNESSSKLMDEFFSSGHHAIITSIDKNKLELGMLAKEYTADWVNKLPTDIDPLGENGEFNTFVTYSPHFRTRIMYSKAIAIDDGPYTITTLKEP